MRKFLLPYITIGQWGNLTEKIEKIITVDLAVLTIVTNFQRIRRCPSMISSMTRFIVSCIRTQLTQHLVEFQFLTVVSYSLYPE